MVRGIESFRKWFQGYEEQYTIIGGTACDLLMTDEGLDFRATKDIDLVLIIEAVDADFGNMSLQQGMNIETGVQVSLSFTVLLTRERKNIRQ